MDLSELDPFILTLAETHQLEKYLNHEGRVSLPFETRNSTNKT